MTSFYLSKNCFIMTLHYTSLRWKNSIMQEILTTLSATSTEILHGILPSPGFRISSNWYDAVSCRLHFRVLGYIWGFCLLTNVSYGQHLAFAREQVKILTSPGFHGRGYVMNGSEIAARYLAAEFSKFNLKQFGNSYYQYYTFPVNTFPGDMNVAINGAALKAGEDFLIYPPSSGKSGRFTVETVD